MFESITDSLGGIFDRIRGKRLTEENIREAMREIRIALLEADVAHNVVKDFISEVSEQAVGEKVIKAVRPEELIVKIVNDSMVELLGTEAAPLVRAPKSPTVIMFCGLQGSGKTTTVGKLATRLLKENHKPLLVAADVQRPAAIEQLKILGEQIDVPVYAEEGGDPVKICERSKSVAELHNADTIILDTAGRLHVDEDLMQELENIQKATTPSEVLLVLDAMTGQDAVTSAEQFAARLPLTGAILTKMDGDARGGAAISLRKVTGVPIKLIGVGEKLDALEEFHPERMAGRILGMGDIVALVEKAQVEMDEEEQEKLQQKFLKNTFTLEDFQKQLAQIRKMGSIKDLLGLLPGVGRQLKGIDIDDSEFKRIEAIIQSMTQQEKSYPELLDYSRKERIAKGSGHDMGDVTALLKQFKDMKKMIGKMGRSGMLSGLMGGGGMPDMTNLDSGDLGGLGGRNPLAGFDGLGGFGGSGTKAHKSKKDIRKERKKKKQNKKRRK